MTITLLDAAKAQLREGYWWYEKQDPGTGDYFLRRMYAEIETLQHLAGIHRKFHGLHRLIPARFPFGIFYTVSGDTVEVCAVIDLRRSPSWIRKRLRG